MDKALPLSDKIAQWYTIVRSSFWFPVGLLGLVGLWYALDALTHFDPGLVVLLTILSVEASVATAFLSRDLALVEQHQREQLKYMLDLLEIIKANTVK